MPSPRGTLPLRSRSCGPCGSVAERSYCWLLGDIYRSWQGVMMTAEERCDLIVESSSMSLLRP